MPVTAFDLNTHSKIFANAGPQLGAVNTTGFLFGDEEDSQPALPVKQVRNSPDANTYLQLHTTDDSFPILVRREGNGSHVLGSSTPTEQESATDRSIKSRHRQSLPPSAMRHSALLSGDVMSPLNGMLSDITTAKNTAANRRSMEVKFSGLSDQPKRPGLLALPGKGSMNGNPRLSSSYSTNDIPTLKSIGVTIADRQDSMTMQSPIERTPASERLQPSFPSIDASSTRIIQPGPTAFAETPEEHLHQDHRRHSQEQAQLRQNSIAQSALQASAAPFGPSASASTNGGPPSNAGLASSHVMTPFSAQPSAYAGYGVQYNAAPFTNPYATNHQTVHNHNQQSGHWQVQQQYNMHLPPVNWTPPTPYGIEISQTSARAVQPRRGPKDGK